MCGEVNLTGALAITCRTQRLRGLPEDSLAFRGVQKSSRCVGDVVLPPTYRGLRNSLSRRRALLIRTCRNVLFGHASGANLPYVG